MLVRSIPHPLGGSNATSHAFCDIVIALSTIDAYCHLGLSTIPVDERFHSTAHFLVIHLMTWLLYIARATLRAARRLQDFQPRTRVLCMSCNTDATERD
jgi:hypothetical protein